MRACRSVPMTGMHGSGASVKERETRELQQRLLRPVGGETVPFHQHTRGSFDHRTRRPDLLGCRSDRQRGVLHCLLVRTRIQHPITPLVAEPVAVRGCRSRTADRSASRRPAVDAAGSRFTNSRGIVSRLADDQQSHVEDYELPVRTLEGCRPAVGRGCNRCCAESFCHVGIPAS